MSIGEEHAKNAVQKELDILMSILEDNQNKISEGEYLRGMNALGSMYKSTQKILTRPRMFGRVHFDMNSWTTLDEIIDDDEELYDEIMNVADDIVVELCGDESSIYTNDETNLVHRGEEQEIFQLLVNYKPEPGNAGYETSPMVLHHAIQVIMQRLFNDTYHELEVVRPVSCQCGWRGVQGNWDRHVSNARHQRWVNMSRQRTFENSLASVRENIIARREEGIVYIHEIHETPEVKIAIEEVVAAAEAAGERVIFIDASGQLSWFA